MPELTDLSEHIANNNKDDFIKTYLLLLIEGYTLSIPKQIKLPDIKEAWSQILSRLYRDFTLEFLEDLSKSWLLLIQKQGGNITDNFPEELLIIINGGNPIDALRKKEALAKEADDRQKALHSQYAEPVINEVKSNISQNYYEIEQAESIKIPHKDKLEKQMTTAIKNLNHIGYLIKHLSVSHYEALPKVPKTTLLERIRSEWEEIIILQHNEMVDETFLDNLSSFWFSIVNQKGIPYTVENIKDILIDLMAKHPNETKEEAPKKKTIFNKLFKK